jgi:hypothetical protein
VEYQNIRLKKFRAPESIEQKLCLESFNQILFLSALPRAHFLLTTCRHLRPNNPNLEGFELSNVHHQLVGHFVPMTLQLAKISANSSSLPPAFIRYLSML